MSHETKKVLTHWNDGTKNLLEPLRDNGTKNLLEPLWDNGTKNLFEPLWDNGTKTGLEHCGTITFTSCCRA